MYKSLLRNKHMALNRKRINNLKIKDKIKNTLSPKIFTTNFSWLFNEQISKWQVFLVDLKQYFVTF